MNAFNRIRTPCGSTGPHQPTAWISAILCLIFPRHIGPNREEQMEMLAQVGANHAGRPVAQVPPSTIIGGRRLALPQAQSEVEALAELRTIAQKNQIFKSFIGQGYVGTVTPRRHPAQHP